MFLSEVATMKKFLRECAEKTGEDRELKAVVWCLGK
jgi:hypothetical protein